uniref:Uncharacterized protein n=1 Tax=Arundo donax TaxID=35708 RepID=A0A0A9DK16_ARUDO
MARGMQIPDSTTASATRALHLAPSAGARHTTTPASHRSPLRRPPPGPTCRRPSRRAARPSRPPRTSASRCSRRSVSRRPR